MFFIIKNNHGKKTIQKTIMLTYPLEMYYPDYDFNVPKMEDQILVINEYKSYIEHCNKRDIEINEKHISVTAMNYLLEKLKQQGYFKGVRDILNFLFSEIKTPDELFISLFPDRESLVAMYKQQFMDACELATMDLNWEEFNLSWKELGDIEEVKRVLREFNES